LLQEGGIEGRNRARQGWGKTWKKKRAIKEIKGRLLPGKNGGNEVGGGNEDGRGGASTGGNSQLRKWTIREGPFARGGGKSKNPKMGGGARFLWAHGGNKKKGVHISGGKKGEVAKGKKIWNRGEAEKAE